MNCKNDVESGQQSSLLKIGAVGSQILRRDRQVANYENHYNSRLNKCIYLEISNTFERGEPPSQIDEAV